MNTGVPAENRRSVPRVLILGIVLALLTAVAALVWRESITVLLGALLALTGIFLTFLVARQQDKETAELQNVVSEIHELLRSNAEKESARDYLDSSDDSDADAESSLPPNTRPRFEEEAIDALRTAGANLDFDNLKWRPKTPSQPTRGNHGWFVESLDDTSNERWFVRKARGMTVRKAMPRDFLEALKSQENFDPRDIKLDYQTKEHGLAAWYARTYDGALWRVWRSNRKSDAGVMVEKVSEQ